MTHFVQLPGYICSIDSLIVKRYLLLFIADYLCLLLFRADYLLNPYYMVSICYFQVSSSQKTKIQSQRSHPIRSKIKSVSSLLRKHLDTCNNVFPLQQQVLKDFFSQSRVCRRGNDMQIETGSSNHKLVKCFYECERTSGTGT